MRTITISTDVFAAIWAARAGSEEETEDDILRRVLGLPTRLNETDVAGGRMRGFYDERSGVHFPEGTRIYRTYRGQKIEALANLDRWFVPSTGKSFHSLHKLSQSIVAGNENSWVNWKYQDEEGNEHLIDRLRQLKGRGAR
jgi:hypothetical protein